MKIGVIGLGYVGETIYKALRVESKKHLSATKETLELIRIDPPKGFNSTYDELVGCDGVFVCVPSPMNTDGSADTSILEFVLENLAKVNYSNVIISKVTAPPDVYKRLQEIHPTLVHVPEFLTAWNAFFDYVMNPNVIIGGDAIWAEKAEKLVKLSKADCKSTTYCSIVDAAVIKYAVNSFLATKVIFFNELKVLAEASGASWGKVRSGVAKDHRIGDSHTFAPGSDGLYGFGGLCFPKDTAALLHYAKNLISVDLSVLRAAVDHNGRIR